MKYLKKRYEAVNPLKILKNREVYSPKLTLSNFSNAFSDFVASTPIFVVVPSL